MLPTALFTILGKTLGNTIEIFSMFTLKANSPSTIVSFVGTVVLLVLSILGYTKAKKASKRG
jgi:hypothetical protein